MCDLPLVTGAKISVVHVARAASSGAEKRSRAADSQRSTLEVCSPRTSRDKRLGILARKPWAPLCAFARLARFV